MKIAIASDLHLEFDQGKAIKLENTENAEVLILAGDICLARYMGDPPGTYNDKDEFIPLKHSKYHIENSKYMEFFGEVSGKFKNVLVIAGNHESYRYNINQTYETMSKALRPFKNVTFVENEGIQIGEILFVGATLWTSMDNNDPQTKMVVGYSMNDFQIIDTDIGQFTPSDAVVIHRETLEIFEKNIPDGKKVVVFTHHAPSPLSISERFRNKASDFMNHGYHTDLTQFILDHPNIKYWFHGHTHDEFDYMVGEHTRVVCNPRGYVDSEQRARDFKLKFVEV